MPVTIWTDITSFVFRNLPYLDEVSIGHAIWAEALFQGIEHVVSDYLALLAADPR